MKLVKSMCRYLAPGVTTVSSGLAEVFTAVCTSLALQEAAVRMADGIVASEDTQK